MPRANVPLGRSSKRPCSIASIWRAPNFSCCAMSATESPSATRAAASSSPTPAATGSATGPVAGPADGVPSVILPALQLLVLARGGEAPPQLIRIARFRGALAELALDAQREPERFGGRFGDPVVAGDKLARLLEA